MRQEKWLGSVTAKCGRLALPYLVHLYPMTSCLVRYWMHAAPTTLLITYYYSILNASWVGHHSFHRSPVRHIHCSRPLYQTLQLLYSLFSMRGLCVLVLAAICLFSLALTSKGKLPFFKLSQWPKGLFSMAYSEQVWRHLKHNSLKGSAKTFCDLVVFLYYWPLKHTCGWNICVFRGEDWSMVIWQG